VSVLTRRQWQIATLIARGLTNADIGTQLGLSDGTVANHVQHIPRRLGVGSRVEIAVWYVQSSNVKT
jgi:two-component system nitrate/nitrite response regulator NarL